MDAIRRHRYAIAGYAARFDVVSPHRGRREQIRPGAFDEALTAGGWHLLENHRTYADHGAQSLASMARGTLRVEEDGLGLWFEASLSDDEEGGRLIRLLNLGRVTGASTGGQGPDYWLRGSGADILTESHPWEISLVTAPARPARRGTWCRPLAEALCWKSRARP